MSLFPFGFVFSRMAEEPAYKGVTPPIILAIDGLDLPFSVAEGALVIHAGLSLLALLLFGFFVTLRSLLWSLRLGFLVVCDCFHRTGKYKFLLILVSLFPFGFAFARMVAAPAYKGVTPTIIIAIDGLGFALLSC